MKKLYNSITKKKRREVSVSFWKSLALVFFMMIFSFKGQAQESTVSGTVKDAQGGTIPGVSVSVKGTTIAVVTANDGKFSIKAPSAQSILVFSYVGYISKEIPVGNSTNLAVTLQEQNNNLNDVVVVGYGTQKKVNVIGSVATIDAKSVENRPVTNLSSSLGGLSAGVSVRQGSGKPGSDGASIRIRGTGTLNSNDALVVIDGIVGSMDAVNPNDVETVSILKDAAAASIYGSLAANGVILITTKKGNRGKTTVSYTGLVSVAEPSNLPTFVTDYITHMKLTNEGYLNLGQTPIYTENTMSLWAAANANPNGLTAQGIPNYVAYPNTDWTKVIFKKNLVQQHAVSLNGGGENTRYLLSTGYINNPGLVDNTRSDKYSLRVNLESKVAKFLTVGTQTFGSYQTFGLASTDNAFNYGRATTPGLYPDYQGRYGFPSAAEESATANNILVYLNSTAGSILENRLNSTVFARFDILKGLQFESRFNYQVRSTESNSHTVTNERWNFASNTLIQPRIKADQLPTSYAFNKDYGITIDNTLKYNTTILKDHDISALLGYNQYYYNYYNFGASKRGLIDESITTLGSATVIDSATGDEYDYGSGPILVD